MPRRTWHHTDDRSTTEYTKGVNGFLQVALRFVRDDGRIRCLCRGCLNTDWHPLSLIQRHLYRNGMAWAYNTWIYHGEEPTYTPESIQHEVNIVNKDVGNDD